MLVHGYFETGVAWLILTFELITARASFPLRVYTWKGEEEEIQGECLEILRYQREMATWEILSPAKSPLALSIRLQVE